MIRRGVSWAGIILTMMVAQVTVAFADRDDDLATLMSLLKIDETIEIMQIEGMRFSADVARDMLPEANSDDWTQTAARIYDRENMQRLIKAGFDRELANADLAPILRYFETDGGQEIVQLEIAARRLFLDPDAEAAAKDRYKTLAQDGAPILDSVTELIQDSDLVELNVMGTLNSSFMFYRGLNDGGAFRMTEAEMLADIWSQEDDARREARDWLGAFLTLAYQPIEAAQLQGYAAFYRTPEGRVLNQAVFEIFDVMYEETSYLLGLAVAEQMTSEPL